MLIGKLLIIFAISHQDIVENKELPVVKQPRTLLAVLVIVFLLMASYSSVWKYYISYHKFQAGLITTFHFIHKTIIIAIPFILCCLDGFYLLALYIIWQLRAKIVSFILIMRVNCSANVMRWLADYNFKTISVLNNSHFPEQLPNIIHFAHPLRLPDQCVGISQEWRKWWVASSNHVCRNCRCFLHLLHQFCYLCKFICF